MGLCKCPKKKVTNLFCFEHRVNVCEHCLVANHPNCVVQSYLQWLDDSDYNPVCRLCQQKLNNDETSDCVRLSCYDVFHWSCLNQYATQMPPNTAPAGYTCPTCKSGIFPNTNVASPVAVALREKLAQVNWARVGLGLPMIEEPEISKPVPAVSSAASISNTQEIPRPVVTPSASINLSTDPPSYTRPSAQVSPYSSTPVSVKSTYSVVNVETETSAREPRKLFHSAKDDSLLDQSRDHDDDKYKRRPAMSWLARWFQSKEGKKRKDPDANMKRFLVVLIIGLIGFLTIIVIFSRIGRNVADQDPFLDPLANPNIRVQDKIPLQ